MSIERSALVRGPAVAKFNSHYFHARQNLAVQTSPVWERVQTTIYGAIDSIKKDLVIKVPVTLWGAWENLTDLFPSYALAAAPGTSIFGSSDMPLLIWGVNGDQLTVVNARITKLANLYLGVDQNLFAADVEFTGLLANNSAPEGASAYSTYSFEADGGGTAYAAATVAFAKTNFKRLRFVAAWGSITDFTAIVPDKGINISWEFDAVAHPVDGYGTVDFSVGAGSLVVGARMIPIGPTPADMKTNLQEEAQMGILGSTGAADLVCTGNGGAPVVTLKNAFLKSYNFNFDANELRMGEAMWETTRSFTSGAPAAVATVA